MNVKDVMLSTDRFPVILQTLFLKEALDVMNEKRLGIACIVDEKNVLKGILTDGDIRRKLLKEQKPLSSLFVDDSIEHAIINPTVTTLDASLKEAVDIMEQKQIWDLPVVDAGGVLVGLLHLHPVVQALLNEKK